MNEAAVFNPAQAEIKIHPQPIKSQAERHVTQLQVEAQAERARNCIVYVDSKRVRGTCGDERGRQGTRNGQSPEPRPSVFGGPDIYGLAVAELIGYFNDDTQSGEDHLRQAKQQLNQAGIKSGGHDGCAANGSFFAWMSIMAQNPDVVKGYAKQQLGAAYHEGAADEVIGFASRLVGSGRYNDWKEDTLAIVLGDEAGEAIEQLVEAPHEGATLIRNGLVGTTVDQTKLYDSSAVGKGSFVHDDWYADQIEHVLTSGPNAVRQKQLAEHAREFIIKAIAVALPNPELHQIDFVVR